MAASIILAVRSTLAVALSAVTLSCAAAQTADQTVDQTAAPRIARPHVAAEVLFWSQAQREAGFPHMESIFPTHTVKRGDHVRPRVSTPSWPPRRTPACW
jgi:hypothetical protein